MSRPASGTVAWKGNPPRWFARVSVHDERGVVRRPWVDLERPDLKNTPDDKKTAKALRASPHETRCERGCEVRRRRARDSTEHDGHRRPRRESGLRSSTLIRSSRQAPARRYKSCFRSNSTDTFGSRRITDLAMPTLRAWVRDLTAEARGVDGVQQRNRAHAILERRASGEGWVTL